MQYRCPQFIASENQLVASWTGRQARVTVNKIDIPVVRCSIRK